MLNFLKKDLLLQLRDYKELALLIGMPLLLIAILGFALGGFGDVDSVTLDVSGALVVQDDEAAGLREFDLALAAADLPSATKLQLGVAARAIRPVQLLRDVLHSPDMAEFASVTELSLPEALTKLDANEVKAVIVVPAGYTRDLLNSMLLDGRPGAELNLRLSDASPLSASVLEDVVESFAAELNSRTAMNQLGIAQVDQAGGAGATGGIERVARGRSVSPFAYYTFGMAMMFMLYVVGTIASRAHLELSNYTFDRIIITNTRPFTYLLSKLGAAAGVAFLQVGFLIVAATLLFGAAAGQPPSFWLATAGVVACLAVSVGALAALLTSVNFRLGSKAASEGFSNVLVFVMSLLGGAFVPLEQSAPALAALGRWLPTGAGLNSLLNLSIGAPLAIWGPNLLRLAVFTSVILIAAVLLFPKRRTV
ncbi:MAG TPA: ABC transporter permease [Trueperaceae bacterium]|nr:ABC transporter permease [Trueperaceae bacterium]